MEPTTFFSKLKEGEYFEKVVRKGAALLKFLEINENVQTLYVTNSFKVIF